MSNSARLLLSAILVAAVVATSSCTIDAPESDAGPTPTAGSNLQTPDIAWPNGLPTEGWEGNRWVEAYIESKVQKSLAYANNDFSDPRLIAAVGYDGAVELADNYAWNLEPVQTKYTPYDFPSTFEAQYVYYGQVLQVIEGERSAVVKVCQIEWNATRPDGLDWESGASWNVVDMGEGRFEVESLGNFSTDVCGDLTPIYGVWTDPINAYETHNRPTVMPAPKSYYAELGVIED